MEELLQLKEYLTEARYDEAMMLVEELEDMAKDDKITRISSFAEIMLIHLIKQSVERRTTRSWDDSILRATEQIIRTNKRRKAGGYYLIRTELQEAFEEAYASSLRRASREAFEGAHSPQEIEKLFDKNALLDKALRLILDEQQAQ
ncbi:MAG: DUF29 family protein [Candidatus Kapaibacterium sp.]|nr:MAG: DUF29 family protein [Candidatus Kapabacteria bacterium]